MMNLPKSHPLPVERYSAADIGSVAERAGPIEMKFSKIPVGHVVVQNRLRATDPVQVKALADSMNAIGLQQPISVWRDRESGETILVAGRNRLAAAEQLGWNNIPAVYVHLGDLDRQLWEIDENLCRSELSPSQFA